MHQNLLIPSWRGSGTGERDTEDAIDFAQAFGELR